MTDDEIDNRIRAGLLRSIHPGVVHHAAAPFTDLSRLLAAVLASGPTAVASHRSAAALHRFEGIRRIRPELTVCDTTKPKARETTVHRTDTLDRVDRCVIAGIPTTGPARTLLDLGAVVPFEVVEHAAEVAVIDKRVTERDLVAVLDRLGKPGRRGTAALRAVVRASIPDHKLESMLELDLGKLLARAGTPPPALQYELVCTDGTDVRLDFAWPELRIAVEADGHRWHATRRRLERDRARRRSIQASGWSHYAYGYGDVHDHPTETIAELRSFFVAFTAA